MLSLSGTGRASAHARSVWSFVEALLIFELFFLVLACNCDPSCVFFAVSFVFVVCLFFSVGVGTWPPPFEGCAVATSSPRGDACNLTGAPELESTFDASRIFHNFFLIFLLGLFFLVLGGLVLCDIAAPPGEQSTGLCCTSLTGETEPTSNLDAAFARRRNCVTWASNSNPAFSMSTRPNHRHT